MKFVYMTNEMEQYKKDIENEIENFNGMNDEFKEWFISLSDNAKNDFLYNFFSTKSVKECMEMFKYCYYNFDMVNDNKDVLVTRVIQHDDLNIMFDLAYNYRVNNGLNSKQVVRIANAICETTSMNHVYPLFELLSKKTVFLPGFYAILKSKDMNYINALVAKLIENPLMAKQEDIEKLVDTLLKIDDLSAIDTLYKVANEVLKVDISKCIKEENIKYILENSEKFIKENKKKDLENIVLQSKNVHEIINLVHRESLANQEINYDRVIQSIIDNGIFDLEDNEHTLGHVMGMMRHKKFPISSYRILEKYLLAMHMEMINEYISLNRKTNYKYISQEMINKHASEEQIEEFKRIIRKNNNLFKKIIDSITYKNYKRK